MFSDVLQKLRKDARLTQDQIAEVLGIPKRTYGSWERDEREPDFEMLCKIADYFGVTTDYLLGRTPMEIELVQGDPQPLPDDQVELIIKADEEAPTADELERRVVEIMEREFKKRGL